MASIALVSCSLIAFVPQYAPASRAMTHGAASPAAAATLARAAIATPSRRLSVAMAEVQRASTSADVEEICDAVPDTCAEIEADADAVFSVIDKDGNGSITREELGAHLVKAGYKESAVDMLFDKLDTNADSVISREELRAGFLKFTPLRSAPGLGNYNAEFVEEIHTDADALFAAIDKDNNGSISKEELREHLKTFSKYTFKAISNIFKLIDVNADGDIEKAELRNAFVKYSALRQAIGEGPTFK